MITDEAELSAWADKRDERKYSRLLLKRVFRGAITAVDSGLAPLYKVQIQRTGEAASDQSWYSCYEAGYLPSVGDEVDLIWRDDTVAYVFQVRGPSVLMASYMRIGKPITVAGTSTGTVTFSGIPQGFQRLKLYIAAQTTNATAVFLNCRLNGDTANNYYGGYGSWATAYNTPAQNSALGVFNVGIASASSSLDDAASEVTFLNYSSNSGNRRPTMHFVSHAVENPTAGNFLTAVGGGNYAGPLGGITSISIFPAAGNWGDGSRFWLDGLF
jgi:hypothetical protein